MRVTFDQLRIATLRIGAATEIEVEEPYIDHGIAVGLEGWLHEASHFVLLFGCLAIEYPKPDCADLINNQINAVEVTRGDRWGAEHELMTLAVEMRVADAIGFEVDRGDLVLYAVENGNLYPWWVESLNEKKNRTMAKQVLRAVEKLLEVPEVVEAAAYLSRAITREVDNA